MKLSILKSVLVVVLGAAITAQAGIYSYSGSAYNIPDGSLGGVSSQLTVSGEASSLSSIAVTFNVSGGYNGDLYAYLSYGGVLVPLVNRIGVSSGNSFGSAGAGMNVTLSDLGLVNIHAAGEGLLSGTYRPDGQNLSPLSPASSFNANGGSLTLDAVGTGFGNLNPNGSWTLFFADVSGGGGTATVNGWSLDITAVPEPVNVALICLGILSGGTVLARRLRARMRVRA